MGIRHLPRFPSAHYTDGRPRFASQMSSKSVPIGGLCGQPLTLDSGWHRHPLQWRVPGGSDMIENLVLLYGNCHRQVHSQNLVVDKNRVP
jgi:hypothetical protein